MKIKFTTKQINSFIMRKKLKKVKKTSKSPDKK